MFSVTGAVVDNTGWLQCPVTFVDSNGTWSNADVMYISFVKSGNLGATGARGSDAGLDMTFESTTTDSDQGVGKVWFNNGTLSSASVLYMDDVDANSASINALVDSWDDSTTTALRGTIKVVQQANPAIFAVYNVTGAVTSASTYSKIPVSLQPGDIQAIMSGKGKQEGVLQYVKGKNLLEINKKIQVLTSGAGEVFKGGIPIGTINIDDEILNNKEDKIVSFHRDLSQLKYVKVVSFLKEKNLLDIPSNIPSKKDAKNFENEINETNQQQETLRILLEQKKIADEIRVKIEKENNFLRNERVRLKNLILNNKKIVQQNKMQNEEIKFLEMNLYHGHKCRKSMLNNLYKVGTLKYRECVLNKGLKK